MSYAMPKPLEDMFEAVADLFRVLNHPARIRILSMLNQHESDVSTIHEQLHISQSSVSQHLKQLKQHGLVLERREGKHIFYRLKSKKTKALIAAAINFLVVNLANESEMMTACTEILSFWS